MLGENKKKANVSQRDHGGVLSGVEAKSPKAA